MKRFLTMAFGMALVFACCIVPSFAASSTPSYPSGTAFGYYGGYAPQASKSGGSNSNFYTAVTASLNNGFWTVNRGFYDLNSTMKTLSTNFTTLKSALYTGTSFSYISTSDGSGGYSSGSTILNAMNNNLFYGFKSVLTKLGTVDTSIGTVNKSIGTMDGHLTTMDGHLTSGFKDLNTKLDTKFTSLENNLDGNFAQLLKALLGSEMSFDFQVDLSSLEGGLGDLNKTVSGGFPMINTWFQVFYNLLFDPLDEELKDKTEDQKQELLDNFFGEDGNGVQEGQIGSLGDISSSAGDLLDTGGNVGDVFTTIGDSSSTVWDWFSSENSDAINGSGGVSLLADEDDALPTPTLEIVDFYGAQRDDFLSILGGGE